MIVNYTELEIIKDYIQKCLEKSINPVKHCKAKLKNGKQCSHKATDGCETCKKHSKSTLMNKKIMKDIVYHDHLPFETSTTCALCNSYILT